jgi:hypothetical protein
MAITDYIPNIFGSTPEAYRGLLDAPEQAALEKRANIGGLLGSLSALSQGMSPQGYRRSPLQNVLTSLAAGYGAAGQTYEAGLNQISNVMKLAQAKRQISGLAALRKAHPDLAYLADVSPDEFVRQVSARERAKMYGLTPDAAAPVAPAEPSITPAVGNLYDSYDYDPIAAQIRLKSLLTDTQPKTFDDRKPSAIPTESQPAPQVANVPTVVSSPAVPSVAPSVVPSSNVAGNVPFFVGVSPENKAKADLLRRKAAIATMQNDAGAADFLKAEADRLDPKEQVFFRDGKAFSTTRGLIADVSGNRVLKPNEAVDMGLDPKLGKWAVKDGIPTLVPNTGVSKEDQKQALIASLPNQLAGVHPTLRNQADALIARAGAMDNTQIVSEVERILGSNSSILGQLNPQLQAAKKATTPSVNVYTGDLSKNTVQELEKGVLTSAEAIGRLNSIYETYNPNYLNIPFRAKQEWAGLKGKFQQLDPKDKQTLTGYSTFKQNALQNLNKTIKDLTGAAMGVQEADRIIASMPNAGTTVFGGDSPDEFEAKLENVVKQTKYALARQNYALKQGIKEKAWEKISLSDMPSIVNKRSEEIAKAYKLDPKKPADKETIKRQLAAEFGIPF